MEGTGEPLTGANDDDEELQLALRQFQAESDREDVTLQRVLEATRQQQLDADLERVLRMTAEVRGGCVCVWNT